MSNTESSTPSAPTQAEKLPPQIGKYKLIRKLGAGGMGAVFLALDEKTSRNVALKVLPREKAKNQTLVKRFRAEAQAAANLEHENIVRVYEADEAEGYLYIALEYVDGTDVNCVLRKRERMPVKRSTEVVRQVALALKHAHEQNIVHRDIKPSNLMIRKDGVVKLTDLGLARSIDESDDTNITRAGTTVGTVDYMAPEQARNSRLADIRSDLYSLGCTWYQMLVGHPPFHEGSMTNKLQAHATARPPDPRDENPDVPESIVIIMQRLMAKDPDDRYQTPQDLLDDLENSRLHRLAPSDHVFSALAASGDSRTDVPSPESDTSPRRSTTATSTTTKPERSSRTKQKGRSGEQPLIPPRDASRAANRPTDETDSSNLSDLAKYILIAGLVIGVFAGIWYIVKGLAGGLDPGATPGVGESQRHIAQEMLDDKPNAAPIIPKPRQTPVSTNKQQPQVIPGQVQQAELIWPERPLPSKEFSKTPLVNPELELTVPQWAQVIPMADEIETLVADWKPKVYTVGRWQNRIGSHISLNAAIAATDKGNVWVRLIGPGPFVLNPTELKDRNLILSTDDPQQEPVIICLAGPRQESASHFLSLENGSLLMAGINVVSAAHQLPPDGTASLISLTRGDFYARDVTMTLYGRRTAATTALTLQGKPNDESARVLFDRSLIRGAWTALETRQSRFSALIINSLLLTDGVPSLSVSASPSAAASDQPPSEPKSRWVRLVQSTIVSSGSLIAVRRGESSAEPPPVTIDAEYSILCASPENSSSLLTLHNWPITGGQAASLHWGQSESVIAGWKSLISASDTSIQPVSDVEGWNAFWKTKTSASEFLADPPAPPQSLDAPTVDPELWHWNGKALPAGTLAGCPSGSIRLPDNQHQATGAGLALVDHSVPTPFAAPPAETVELNLDRTNLQARLSQKDWKSGTRFLLSGTKPNMLNSVMIDGRSLTLEMAPDQPDAFRLEPRGSQTEPLITVRNGSLRMTNVRLKIPNRTRNAAPRWAVSVTNGSLLIEDSLFEGPYIENENHSGLIQWSTGSEGRSLRADSPHRHQCTILSSYLTTYGTTVSLQPQQGVVNLWDTTLAADGTAIMLKFTDGQADATLDFRRSTFTASDAIVSIAGSPNDQPRPIANCIIQECVFAAPLPGAPGQQKPTLLEAPPDWVDRRRCLWWERANAYSTEITCYIRTAEGASPRTTLDDWKTAWGIENVQKPLNAPDGVLLKDKYPTRASIPPEFFQLDERSRALSWAPDGSAVGATPANYIFLPTKVTDDKVKKTTRPTSAF